MASGRVGSWGLYDFCDRMGRTGAWLPDGPPSQYARPDDVDLRLRLDPSHGDARLVAPGASPEAAPVAFKLQDFRGAWHRLEDVREGKAVVIAFLGVDCPMASLYAPRLAELARGYEKKGVAFFGVDANQQDAPSSLSRFAQEHGLTFPFLKDVGNELADRLGVDRTPEVFVLDAGRVVRYRGRVDDQYGFGVHRPAPTRRDLAEALDAMLAGRPVATPKTEPVGCRIGRIAKSKGAGDITYSRQVARILRDRCVACHRDGEIAPFSLFNLRPGRRLGRDDRRGRAVPSHASLARQSRARLVLERGPAQPRGEANDRRLGCRAHPRATLATYPSRLITSKAGASPPPTWSSPCRSPSRSPPMARCPTRTSWSTPSSRRTSG